MQMLQQPLLEQSRRQRLVANHLDDLGFIRETNHRDDGVWWFGALRFEQGELKIRLVVNDWDFLTLPKVFLEAPLPKWFVGYLPMSHVFCNYDLVQDPKTKQDRVHYDLCYSQTDAHTLSAHHPHAMIDWVVEQAQRVIHALISNAQHRQEENLREIEPLWSSMYTFLSNQDKGVARKRAVIDQSLSGKYCHRHIHWTRSDQSAAERYNTLFIRVDGKAMPDLTELFTPSNSVPKHSRLNNLPKPQEAVYYTAPSIGTMLAWLAKWDGEAARRLIVELLAFLRQPDADWYPICLQAGPSFLSFSVLLDKRKPPTSLNGLLNLKVQLLPQPINMTPEYVYGRNLQDLGVKNLAGLSIVLVGCGAIGGYLAANLARLGAGSAGGELWLVDPDDLGAHNVGRHVLGRSSVGLAKASELKKQLIKDLVDLKIHAVTASIFDTQQVELQAKLINAGLIVDATGKAELSDGLSERWHVLTQRPPLLHVWIRANGECVQGLFVDADGSHACHLCINKAGEDVPPELEPLLGLSAKHSYLACSDFTPYSVSASMSAASLAADMVMDYINGDPAPRYRTRYNERWKGERITSSCQQPKQDYPHTHGHYQKHD